MNNHWLKEVTIKLNHKKQLLFDRKSPLLQPLLSLIRGQSHPVLIGWAFNCASPICDYLEAAYPNDNRPQQAMALCRQWAQGEIKMPRAKKAILEVHAMAKEATSPVDALLCHALAQGLSTVHVETHAIGLAFYELTALVHLHGLGNCIQPIEEKTAFYLNCLHHFKKSPALVSQPWAAFILKEKPNKEQLLFEKTLG